MSAFDQKAQSAFAAFFQLMQTMGVAPFADMMWAPDATLPTTKITTIRAALTGFPFQLPDIICRAEKFEELTPGCNVFSGTIAVIISSSLDDDKKANPSDPDGSSLHSGRTRAAFQCLFDVGQDESNPVARALALPYLNKPAAGADTRAVKDFTCSCYTLLDETNGWDERHVETSLLLHVTASWGDLSRPFC